MTSKQAEKIYFLIYSDRKNKANGLYEPTKSQEVMRENLWKMNGWDSMENSFHLIDKIMGRLTIKQASYVIGLLLERKYKKAEEILINYK